MAVLVVGLVIGGFAGRWSVSDINVFKETDPPSIPPKDPHITVLDEFDGMCVLHFPVFFFSDQLFFHRSEIRFRQREVWIRTLLPRNPTKKRS